MVDGVYVIIQARMNSERLPNKVMKKINGIPLIGILIQRLKKQSAFELILATSTNNENDLLADYVASLGVSVFRGSESNVLERYYLAAKSVNAKTVVRLTGDNILLDAEFLKEKVYLYESLQDERAYLSTSLSQTFPLGVSLEVFSFSLLEEAYQKATLPGEFEHVTPYMHQNVPGDIHIFSLSAEENKYHYRLTVDTKDDFYFTQVLIERYGCDQKGLPEIIKLIDENQDLLRINSSSIQKKWND